MILPDINEWITTDRDNAAFQVCGGSIRSAESTSCGCGLYRWNQFILGMSG
jgi:hypothetical protein